MHEAVINWVMCLSLTVIPLLLRVFVLGWMPLPILLRHAFTISPLIYLFCFLWTQIS